MGCLQRSVWISPDDIRPAYDDLARAAGIRDFTFLFESKTVLGRSPEEVVMTAWPMQRLHEVQRHFCEAVRRHMEQLTSGHVSPEAVMTLAREESAAYASAMRLDPLLPSVLWPSDYMGRQVFSLHKQIVRELGKRL